MYLSSGLEVVNSVTVAVATGQPGWLVGAVVGGSLWIWMARTNRMGWPWARALGTVLFGAGTLLAALEILVQIGFLYVRGMQALIAFEVFRWVLALVIVALLWSPESSRYYRYMGREAAGQPQRETPGSAAAESVVARVPDIPPLVTDEEVDVLRAYIHVNGPAEFPDSDLADAAFTEVVARRFGRNPAKLDVSRYVAEVLRRPAGHGLAASPRVAERLVLAALKGQRTKGIDPKVRQATRGLLFRTIVSDESLGDNEIEALLAAARHRADYSAYLSNAC
jgi:hypothetical protein